MSYKSVIQFWTNYQLPVQPPSPNMYTKTIVAAAGQATNSIFLSFLETAFINLAKIEQASHEASRGPLKGAVSAQKTIEESEMETRELLGGREENCVSPMRGH